MELHDHLAQLLVLGRLKLGQAKRVPGVACECTDLIEQADDVLSESLAYTRTLITDLSPPVLREYGLLAALGWLAQQMQRYQLAVKIELSDMPPLFITEEQGVMLFQSVRELLINISKHAQTETATVRVRCQQGVMYLDVQDAGCGLICYRLPHSPSRLSSYISQLIEIRSVRDSRTNESIGREI